ncbi:unnamed protein product [Colias eurytheme]|nr:unnamed protein product [Colias eurytheme]
MSGHRAEKLQADTKRFPTRREELQINRTRRKFRSIRCIKRTVSTSRYSQPCDQQSYFTFRFLQTSRKSVHETKSVELKRTTTTASNKIVAVVVDWKALAARVQGLCDSCDPGRC